MPEPTAVSWMFPPWAVQKRPCINITLTLPVPAHLSSKSPATIWFCIIGQVRWRKYLSCKQDRHLKAISELLFSNSGINHLTAVLAIKIQFTAVKRQTLTYSSDSQMCSVWEGFITCSGCRIKNDRSLGCFSPTALKGNLLHDTLPYFALPFLPCYSFPCILHSYLMLYPVHVEADKFLSHYSSKHSCSQYWGDGELSSKARELCTNQSMCDSCGQSSCWISSFSFFLLSVSFHLSIFLISAPKPPSLLPMWPNSAGNFVLLQKSTERQLPTHHSPGYCEQSVSESP